MRRGIVAVFLATAVLGPVARAANVADFSDFTLLANNNSVLLPGRLYEPPEASESPRPLVLFLHGAGESGTNNLAQINGNIDYLLLGSKQRGAFLYAPQTNGGWASTTITDYVSTMLDRALADYNVDPSRIYVTGLSMGGGGVWNMINRYGDRFAAAVPIAAVSPASDYVPTNLVHEPFWISHARNDSVVPVTRSREVINDLLLAAGEDLPAYPALTDKTTWFYFDNQKLDLHYEEFPIGDHGVWNYVYHNPPTLEWMFAHSLVPEPSSLVSLLVGLGMVLLCRRAIQGV